MAPLASRRIDYRALVVRPFHFVCGSLASQRKVRVTPVSALQCSAMLLMMNSKWPALNCKSEGSVFERSKRFAEREGQTKNDLPFCAAPFGESRTSIVRSIDGRSNRLDSVSMWGRLALFFFWLASDRLFTVDRIDRIARDSRIDWPIEIWSDHLILNFR